MHTPRTALRYEGGLAPIFLDKTTPDRILVPSAVDFSSPATAPNDGSHLVDHYKCYRARTTKSRPRYFPSQAMASFSDTLETRNYVLKSPRHLCTPVSADGSVIKTLGRHLLCFPARRDKFSRKHVPASGIFTANEIAGDIVDTTGEEELCVPSALIP